jgi:hypothetical protein
MILTPGPITVYRQEQPPERIEFPQSGNGYQYDAAEVMRCMDCGLMETLYEIRNICKITYKQDDV